MARPDATLPGVAQQFASEAAQTCRLAILATDLNDLFQKLTTVAAKILEGKRSRMQTRDGIYFDVSEKTEPLGKMAFLFPGQGSQYPGMLADLCLAFPRVREHFDLSDAAFAGTWEYAPSHYVFPPPTCLKPSHADALREKFLGLDVAMETVNTSAMAIYELLDSFNLRCDMMLGHSTGEYAALIASGAVDVRDVREQIALKRRLNQFGRNMKSSENAPRGSLLAIGAVEPDVLDGQTARYEGRVCVAMDNCPHQKILLWAAGGY